MEAGIPARLTPAEGRKFGLTVGGAFLMLAALLHWWRHREIAAAVLCVIGTLLVLSAVAVPSRLGPVQRGWMGMAKALSKVTTPIFMGVVFFVVMTPIGLLRRRLGRNSMVHEQREGSFWAAPSSGGRSKLERQF